MDSLDSFLNDSSFLKEYLIKCQGFKESDMLILLDDGKHHSPTRQNIEQAFTRITQYSQAGDVVVSFTNQILYISWPCCQLADDAMKSFSPHIGDNHNS
jgi:hypothetical protein